LKRLIKRPFKALWRWTSVLRRPIARKAEAFLIRAYMHAPIPAPHVHVGCNCRVNEETGVLMDFMVRELVRLQDQVERLQYAVVELAPTGSAFHVVNGLEADDAVTRSVAG
jgi:hypothetical protein